MLAILLATHQLSSRPILLPDGFNEAVTIADTGEPIPYPTPGVGYSVRDGRKSIQIPVGTVVIPAGKFTMKVGAVEKSVGLQTYAIGKFDVTNAEYKEFVDATSRTAPSSWRDGQYPEGRANHPVTFVSLQDAQAYAAWVSKSTGWHLAVPTPEQWEKAASGLENQVSTNGETSPVGADRRTVSRYGIYDMAGNVGNWTSPRLASPGQGEVHSKNVAPKESSIGFRIVALPPFAPATP